MTPRRELYEKVETFQNMLISYSRYETGNVDATEFKKLRAELLNDPLIKDKLPSFVRTCRDFPQFFGLFQNQSQSYKGRRQFICGQFAPVFDFLERAGSPADDVVSGILGRFDTEHVEKVWSRALERRAEDPEGAITSARTLLEAVCKHILDENGVDYDEDTDLPKLYRRTADALNLAPGQQSEEIFKRIFSGCHTVVENLGALRNKLSDAHGKGKNPAKPEPRHAELAVNLAGAIATFLVETWEAQQKE